MQFRLSFLPYRKDITINLSQEPVGNLSKWFALGLAAASTVLSVSNSAIADVSAVPVASGAAAPDYSPALVADLVKAGEQGNGKRGASVFASAKFGCIACHKVGEHGGQIGPDLSTIGKQRKPEQIVESLLWPKREVAKEFVPHRVVTVEGKLLQGYLQSQTDSHLELRDPSTLQITKIPVDDIDVHVHGDTLMPDGLTSGMNSVEKQDLIKFLSQLGRDGGIAAESVAPVLARGLSHAHGPAKFEYELAPLKPENWPLHRTPTNSLRVYDFYEKQADYFRKQEKVPALLMEFPGVEGPGGDSEMRRQAKEDDSRWNDSKGTPVLTGVFRSGDLTVPRGICVRLGENGDMGVCFNPETLQYEALWNNGFLKFSPVRHGFMDGLVPAGTLLPTPEPRKIDEPFVYQGFYRDGNQVVFAYKIGNVEYLDAPVAENGVFKRIVAPVEQHPLRSVLQGGAPLWNQEIVCPIEYGKGKPYAVDTIQLPFQNPWNDLLFLGGVAFLPDGAALICTMQGDVWRADGFEAPSKQVRWRKVASGMQQAQGIVADKDGVFVLGRDQITKLHDLNGDGEYEFNESFCNGYVTSIHGHDFICGLERDAAGNFYASSSKQGLLKISPDGKTVSVIATGFRNPDGVGIMTDGTVTVPVSQGQWTPASMICAVRPPFATTEAAAPYFGYGGPKDGKPPELPFAYLPRGLDNSSGGQTVVRSEKWGPLEGQLLHFSYGASRYHMILRDEVAGQIQGGVVPMVGDFRSGVHRGLFSPKDGQLYVAGQAGWGAFTVDDGNFERVRYTGDKVQLPVGFHTYQNGVRIDFSEPIDPQTASNVRNHFAQCWNYRYSGAYGSPEFSAEHPGTPGHDVLEIQSAHVLKDGKSLFLEIQEIQPVNQLYVRMQVDEGDPQDLFMTVHKLDQPFTDFAGYEPFEKVIRQHPIIADLALESNRVPNPWRTAIKGARKLTLKTSGNLQFASQNLKAKAGEVLQFTLSNPDTVPHNWALLKPGKLETVGKLSNLLVGDPDGYAKQYIPATDDVVAYVDIVDPGKSLTIFFKVPDEPGQYPYVCTFPGHWTVMNGVLTVTK